MLLDFSDEDILRVFRRFNADNSGASSHHTHSLIIITTGPQSHPATVGTLDTFELSAAITGLTRRIPSTFQIMSIVDKYDVDKSNTISEVRACPIPTWWRPTSYDAMLQDEFVRLVREFDWTSMEDSTSSSSGPDSTEDSTFEHWCLSFRPPSICPIRRVSYHVSGSASRN